MALEPTPCHELCCAPPTPADPDRTASGADPAPAVLARSAASCTAVTRMVGIAERESRNCASRNCSPSITGIIRSRRTTLGSSRASRSSPSLPLLAVITGMPLCFRQLAGRLSRLPVILNYQDGLHVRGSRKDRAMSGARPDTAPKAPSLHLNRDGHHDRDCLAAFSRRFKPPLLHRSLDGGVHVRAKTPEDSDGFRVAPLVNQDLHDAHAGDAAALE